MLKKSFFLCFFLLQTTLHSQNLIPYLGANGKYGYATESGKVVIEPALEELPPMLAGEIAVECKQKGMPLLLLRNGMTLSSKYRPANKPVENFGLENFATRLDSFGHLAFFYGQNKILFVNLKKQTSAEYLDNNRVQPPEWFYENFWLQRSLHPGWTFRLGAFKVYKAPEQINFLDTDLREIFSRDFAAGTVADAQHFIVAEGPGKLAIADRSGKVRTPFVWETIQPGGKVGFFIVNGPRHPTKEPGRAGVIDADGNIIVDTVYSFIGPVAGGQLLLVQDGAKLGLLDFTGDYIVPVEVEGITPNDTGSRIVVTYAFGQNNIVDSNGRQLLPKNFRTINPIPGNELFSFFNAEGHQTIADADGKVLFADSVRNFSIIRTEPLQFRTEQGPLGQKKYGICDAKGKTVVPDEYDLIRNPERNLEGFYQVSRDSLWGIFDKQGKVVLPVRYAEIRFENLTNDSVNVWVRERGSKLWSGYDNQLQKIPIPDYFRPDSKQEEVVFMDKNWQANTYSVVLQDGTALPLPDGLEQHVAHSRQYKTPDGGFVLLSAKHISHFTDVFVYNHRFEDILPLPFFLSKKYSRENRPEATGLLVAYRNPDPGGVVVPPVGVETPPFPPQYLNAAGRPRFQEPGNFNASSGVLNALGEWVLGPTKGVRYVPLSYHVVVEVPFSDQFRDGQILRSPIKIHTVNVARPAVFEVNFIQYSNFWTHRNSIRFGKFNESFNRQLYTYYHADGRELTAFNIVEGPGHLVSKNLVTSVDTERAERQMILDENGEVVHVMVDMLSGTRSYTKYEVKPVDYLVVQSRNDLPAEKKGQNLSIEEILKLQETHSPDMGLMDSTGQQLLPLRFKNLKIIVPHRLLSAANEVGQTQLLDWQGDPIHTFPADKDLTQRVLPDGRILVADGQRTLLLSADDRVLQEFPVVMQPVLRKEVEVKNFFRAKDVNGHDVWVGLGEGKVYRE